jgi:hypothetical protein
MIGFEIWYDGNCIHEETGFEDVGEMEQSAIEWWFAENDEAYPSEYLVKLFDGEDSDEMTIKELLYWWFD